MEAFKAKWVNSDDIQYRINSPRLEGHRINTLNNSKIGGVVEINVQILYAFISHKKHSITPQKPLSCIPID